MGSRNRKSKLKVDTPLIGYFLRTYPRFSQTFVVNELLEMERQGLNVHILSQRRPADGIFHESVCRVRARADYLPETLIGNLGRFRNTLRVCRRRSPRGFRRAMIAALTHRAVTMLEFCQAASLARWAHKRRIAHIHVHFGTGEATVAWLAGMMGGPSYSLTLHAFDIFRANVDRPLLSKKINGSRFTVTVCEANRRFMIDNLPDVDADRIRVHYNGVDLRRFRSNGHVREPDSVFAVGRLIEKKGFIHLVRAVARLREQGNRVTCRIAGEGQEEDRLRQEIKRLGLSKSVELLGALRQDRIREQMQRATCLVLPCVQAADGNVDALPTVLLEAQACGCPVISTRISGVPEIIEDGISGRLAEPGDETGLAMCIRDVLCDPGLADSLSRGGRARAENRFDVRANGRRLRNWLVEAARAPLTTVETRADAAMPIDVSPEAAP
jgi:glycosyltransferase involved in cell wall biosynthesis